MTQPIKRREFITLLGGAAAVSSSLRPSAAHAQPGERVRRIGVLSTAADGDPYQKANLAALLDGLAKLGWVEGRNLRIDVRLASGDPARIRAYAAELVSLAPEVIVTTPTPATIAVQQQTKTIPIVFTAGGDPVLNGVVRSIARPEGNTTGFSTLEASIAGKWLELLKEAEPRLSRVALLFNPNFLLNVGEAYISVIEAAASALALQTIKLPVRDAIEIVRGVDGFAAEPNGGLLVLPPVPSGTNRDTIIRLAVQHRLPAIYNNRDLASAGGLMSYGPDGADQYRRTATYVDRLLRGAKVSDLPVQFPTKFELVINLKTAKAIGLTIPEAFLLRADEVIE
jgi:putative ABC transport system substrate-binding protein